jgi:hypothetical protein
MDATPFLVQRSRRLPRLALRPNRATRPDPPTHSPTPDKPAGNRPNPAQLRRIPAATVTLAHTRIRELDDENRRLQNQVAELHGQLRGTRLRGTPVADTVHDKNNLVRLPNDRTDPR